MEELIFFAVIIFFTILESIARSRKAKQGGGIEDEAPTRSGEWDEPSGSERGEGARREAGDGLPTYDQEPSYDDLATGPTGRKDRTLGKYTRPYGAQEAPAGPSEEDRRPSSETMLPGDLLEQLESLARGRQAEGRGKPSGAGTEEARRRVEVRRLKEEVDRRREEARLRQDEALDRQEGLRQRGRRDLPVEASPKPLPSLERTEVGSGDIWSGSVGSTAPVGSRAPIGSREHAIHGSHGDYGTDPSSRRPSAEGRIDPFAEPLDAQGVAVRRQLLRGGRKALRDAVVIKEVLGEPVGLRDDHLGGR